MQEIIVNRNDLKVIEDHLAFAIEEEIDDVMEIIMDEDRFIYMGMGDNEWQRILSPECKTKKDTKPFEKKRVVGVTLGITNAMRRNISKYKNPVGVSHFTFKLAEDHAHLMVNLENGDEFENEFCTCDDPNCNH